MCPTFEIQTYFIRGGEGQPDGISIDILKIGISRHGAKLQIFENDFGIERNDLHRNIPLIHTKRLPLLVWMIVTFTRNSTWLSRGRWLVKRQ